MPIPGRGANIGERIGELQRLAAERGRPPIPVTVFGARPDAEVLAHYATAGVDRCLFVVPPKLADEVLPLLDHHAELVAKLG